MKATVALVGVPTIDGRRIDRIVGFGPGSTPWPELLEPLADRLNRCEDGIDDAVVEGYTLTQDRNVVTEHPDGDWTVNVGTALFTDGRWVTPLLVTEGKILAARVGGAGTTDRPPRMGEQAIHVEIVDQRPPFEDGFAAGVARGLEEGARRR